MKTKIWAVAVTSSILYLGYESFQARKCAWKQAHISKRLSEEILDLMFITQPLRNIVGIFRSGPDGVERVDMPPTGGMSI